MVLATAQVSLADCQSDCKKVIDASDKLIKDLQDEISVRKQLEEVQTKDIADLNVSLNDKNQELMSWSRNPYIMGLLGFVVGGSVILYLRR